MAGKSSLFKDEFVESPTIGGSDKEQNVNQNEMVSSNAVAIDIVAGERHGLRCDIHKYFFNFHDEMKEKAKEILEKTYESDGEKVMDLFNALKIKPFFNELPSITSIMDCLISVEGYSEIKCYEFYVIAFKIEIHAYILDYFRNKLS